MVMVTVGYMVWLGSQLVTWYDCGQIWLQGMIRLRVGYMVWLVSELVTWCD